MASVELSTRDSMKAARRVLSSGVPRASATTSHVGRSAGTVSAGGTRLSGAGQRQQEIAGGVGPAPVGPEPGRLQLGVDLLGRELGRDLRAHLLTGGEAHGPPAGV